MSGDRLYGLLPAIYRIRDAEEGQPLRALLAIIEEQLEIIEQDIGGLYDDWFIETCEEWVVPYIADLLGARLLHNIDTTGLFSQRALVANTLRFRRRKGTLLMLEDLARDVTGWRAHAVEFFELLGWTQHLNHLRYDIAPNPNPRSPDLLNPAAVIRVGTVNLRSLDVVDRIDGPFDGVSHTVDVRPPGRHEGWHNIRNLGIFLWRLQSYPLRGIRPEPSEDYADGFHFSPLGNPAPLFNNPDREREGKGLTTEVNVPGPIRCVAFYQNPADYYGTDSDKSLAIFRGEEPLPEAVIPVEEVLCKDLSDWSPPPPGRVAVDVKLGRLAFAPGETPAEGVTVNYHYGFSADIGGGPYDRRTTLERSGVGDFDAIVAANPGPGEFATIAAAIAAWNPAAAPRAVMTITDNATYDENLSVSLVDNQHLIIQADDRNRPTVRWRDDADALSVLTVAGGAGEDAVLTLNGLLIEGGLRVDAESLGRLEIAHCTLVPGRALDEQGTPVAPAEPSLDIDPDNVELEVTIDACILGAVRAPELMRAFTVHDSIIDRPEDPGDGVRLALAQSDAPEPGPVTTLERSTILGEVRVRALELASEVIFYGAVLAERRQTGCVRYSYVDGLVSITPRRFRCQPDLALATRRERLQVETLSATEQARIRAAMRPDFTSVHYGDPGYAQLSFATAWEIRSGSEGGAEMGVYERLKQPQRETNLRVRLDEYMPYGMDVAILFVT